MATTAARFTKNQVVTPTAEGVRRQVTGVRPATQEETRIWYTMQDGPCNDAGESWIHSGTTYVPLYEGMRLQVIRGACTARVGWVTEKGHCEVKDLATGNVFKVNRRWLTAK